MLGSLADAVRGRSIIRAVNVRQPIAPSAFLSKDTSVVPESDCQRPFTITTGQAGNGTQLW